jgi:hypothetical protein
VSWLPEPRVRIGGVDYSGSAVGSVSIRRGRDTVYSQPGAGYANVELLDRGGMRPLKVGEVLSVSVLDSSGDRVRLFTGQVSDWESSIERVSGGVLVAYKVTAVGPLARLNRRTVLFDGRPEQLDGARVFDAIAAGLATSWEEVSPSLSWSAVDPEKSWETFEDGFDPDLIDPGVFALAPLDASDSGYSSLGVVQDAASSAEGVVYETPTGFIAYSDADRRTGVTAYEELPFGSVQASGLTVRQQFADVTNRVTVEYAGGAVTLTFAESVAVFGEVLATQLRTSLADLSAAQQRGELFLERHGERTTQLGRLAFNLRGVSDALRDVLLGLNTGSAIRLEGLPSALGRLRFSGFVEGVDYRVDDYRVEVGLLVSEEALSTGSVRWSTVPASIDWTSVDPALEWQDARSVT